MANRAREGTVLEAKKAKVKPPPLFKVMLLNDDYTPMEFVVVVLQKFFGMTREELDGVFDKWANKDLFRKEGGRWVRDFEIGFGDLEVAVEQHVEIDHTRAEANFLSPITAELRLDGE